MSVSSRKTIREGVALGIQTDITAFQAVYNYLPKAFDGQSPVCTVESGPLSHQSTPDDPEKINLIIGIFVRRDDAATAEDQLDDLAQSLWDFLETKHNAEPLFSSDPGYAEIDGILYRYEWHPITLQWW
jgi:hypothetical protein